MPFVAPARALAALALAACLGAAPVAAQETTAPEASRAAIEAIVREYILAHPEVVEEALRTLEAQREAAAEAALVATILERSEELANDRISPFAGDAEADVTIVEFLDYRCGFCRRAAPIVRELLAQDRDLRVVFKDLPILGPDSVAAARVALAAHEQDGYARLHAALYATDGPVNGESALALAGALGLDIARLRADMDDPAIEEAFARNEELARALEVRGTPAFVIGTAILPGFSSLADMQAAVAAERGRLAAMNGD
jgi:protein-disulfide isomerase